MVSEERRQIMSGRKITRVFITSVLKWSIMEVSEYGDITMKEQKDYKHEGKISFESANKLLRKLNTDNQIVLLSIREIRNEYEMSSKMFKELATKKDAK